MKEIPLTNTDAVVVVDDEDYDRLARHRWNMHPQRYAIRGEQGRTIYMHREIVGAKPEEEVDHIDRDGLNNRRGNLRIVTHSGNMKNRRPPQISWKGRAARIWSER